MKRALSAWVAFAAAISLAGCVPGRGGAFHERVDVTRPLRAGGSFSLENTNGSIHLSAWDEPRVRIEANKAAASRRALERLEVLVEGEGDSVSVRTRQERGFWNRGGSVSYDVTLPRGVSVRLKNVNGNIEVAAIGGSLDASTVNGQVSAGGVVGAANASSVNGGIEVAVAGVAPGTHNRLATTNGSVRVTLPRAAAAEIVAHTVNGSVRCDFELDGGARKSRRRVEGRIAGGGALFELATVNGSAHVEEALAPAPTAGAGAKPPAEAGGIAR